jgi:hypothetical protein
MFPIRILVVADSAPDPARNGGFVWGDSQQDTYFTLHLLVETLRSSNQYISADTAHRSGDPDATIKTPFNFSTTVPNLSAYDEIWLFGYAGSNSGGSGSLNFISEDELAAIATFMDNGGGILATGDHAGLGSLMCGRIPRVRSMRKWFHVDDTDPLIPAGAPRNWPGIGSTRADTTVADKDNQWTFDNQSDDVPQQLNFPGGVVHPIMYGSAGPIKTFPDHMHEGEVLGFGGITGSGLRTPWKLDDTIRFSGKTFLEFPTANGHQELPIVIATGIVTGGHQTLIEKTVRLCETNNFRPDTNETIENEINILSVYDGHTVGVGRVVTDSSFHHFLDLNLTGDSCAPDGSDKRFGFQTPAGEPHLQAMKDLFLNLANWLAGPCVKSLTSVIAPETGSKPRIFYIHGNKEITQAALVQPNVELRPKWVKSVLPGNPTPQGTTLASMAVSANDIRLYYINIASRVSELAWNGTSWANSTLPSGEAKANTSLTCFIINGHDLRLYYVNAANQINELRRPATTSGWTNNLLPSNQVRPNSPVTSFAVAGTEPRIYYIDTQDHVNELAWIGHWTNQVLPSGRAFPPFANPAYSDSGLACIGLNGRDSRVYYVDESARLNSLKWVGDHWVNDVLFEPAPAGPIESGRQGGAVACLANGLLEPRVLYVSAEDSIVALTPDVAVPGVWDQALVGEQPVRLRSEISVLRRGDTFVDVFYVGRDVNVYVATWDGSEWTSGAV